LIAVRQNVRDPAPTISRREVIDANQPRSACAFQIVFHHNRRGYIIVNATKFFVENGDNRRVCPGDTAQSAEMRLIYRARHVKIFCSRVLRAAWNIQIMKKPSFLAAHSKRAYDWMIVTSRAADG